MKGEEKNNKTKVKRLINTSLRSKLYKAYNEMQSISIVVYSCAILIILAKTLGYIMLNLVQL